VPIALAISLAACGGGATVAQSVAPPIIAPPSSSTATPVPSVDQATDPRIDGVYDVEKRVTSVRHFNGLAVGDVLHRTYRVRPSCPIGPCGGPVTIHLDESRTTIRRRLAYDAATKTYSLVPAPSPVICTGVDGRRYRLKNTTDTVVITPAKTASTGIDVIATTWTAVEMLRAVPDGKALNRGHCRTTSITYRYLGTLQGSAS
jgi:hypothetical protein